MKLFSLLLLSVSLSACVAYGHRQFVPSERMQERMNEDSARIQADERADRTERRKEYYETIDKQAGAYRKATGGRNVYIVH